VIPVFLDANIPIYAAGRPHPLKLPCLHVLRLVGIRPSAFTTDAEVLQELIHVYLGRADWNLGRVTFDLFAHLMHGRVEPMLATDVKHAAALAGQHGRLSARDLIHLAVMARVGATRIVSTDRGFDGIANVQRLDPADVAVWRELIAAP
jgi:predicted nucleic acid-binding protein